MSTQLRPCVVRCGASGFAVDYWGHNDAIGTSTEHYIERRLPAPAYPRPVTFPRVSHPRPQLTRNLAPPPIFSNSSGAYFLTHAHADHLVGLSNRWDPRGRAIYCSAVTKALLLRKFPKLATRADVRVVAVAPNRASVIPLPPATSNSPSSAAESIADALLPAPRVATDPELLTVTALDAGHCPGSVGFLFEGACGRIFHTGDFRREDWCGRGRALGYAAASDDALGRARPRAPPQTLTLNPEEPLPECLTRAPLDLLLLDNTYAHPEYAFPTRAEAAAEVVRLVTDVYPNRDVYVGVDSLGKEPLLAAIAFATGAPVRVAFERADAARAALEAAEAAAAEEHEAAVNENDDADADRAGFARGSSVRLNSCLGVAPSGVLTASSSATGRVFALPKQRVTREKLAAIARHSRRRVVGILPTGWSSTGGCGAPVASAPGAIVAATDTDADYDPECPPVHAVPYSLHAPHVELEALVAALRPLAVVGNTKSQTGDSRSVDAAARYGHLVGTPPTSEDETEEWEEEDVREDGGRGSGVDGSAEDAAKRFRSVEERTRVRGVATARRAAPAGHGISDVFGGGANGDASFRIPGVDSNRRGRSCGRSGGIALRRAVVGVPAPVAKPPRDRPAPTNVEKNVADGNRTDAVEDAVEDAVPRNRRRGGTYLSSVLALFGRGVRRRRDASAEVKMSADANAPDQPSAKRRHVPAWMSPRTRPA